MPLAARGVGVPHSRCALTHIWGKAGMQGHKTPEKTYAYRGENTVDFAHRVSFS